MSIVSIGKTALYRGGILGGYHRLRNRRRLTVAMFHRVLDEQDPRWNSADPAWTISARLFADCLNFFQAHYQIIDLDQLLTACEHSRPLPERPLLITFDDGWADNAEYALPRLRIAGLPAVFFVAAGGVGQRDLWNERLSQAWRLGHLNQVKRERLWDAAAECGVTTLPQQDNRSPLWGLVLRLSGLGQVQRQQLLTEVLADHTDDSHCMLSQEQLRQLYHAGMAIGAHGFTHSPIPATADPLLELREPRQSLANMLGIADGPVALSFPHGAYDGQSVDNAFRFGYRVVFHSDPYLAECPHGFPRTAVFGRIPVQSDAITDRKGRFSGERLAAWLFLRPSV